MASKTLTQMIDDAKVRADMENSDFVSESGWKSFINAALGDLYDLLVASFGEDYFAITSSPISVAAGDGQTSLPADFYKLLGIEILSGSTWRPMKDFQFAERSLYDCMSGTPRYCIQADAALFKPSNHFSFTVRFIYVPEFTKLSALSDVFHFKSSWDDYVTIKAAIKAKDKEESDTTVLIMELASAEKNIKRMAPNRDANRPKKVIDIESVDAQEYEY